MNDAFIAMTNSQDLRETLFFAGFEYVYEKQIIRGKKTYVYTTPDFVLKIQGKNIYLNDVKYRWVSEVRKDMCARYLK
jgi:hypothetical protein